MSTSSAPPLAHKSVATIWTPSQNQDGSTPLSSYASPRSLATAYGSPSTIRAEEETVILELGSRHVRAGFAGDALPLATLACGPEQQRRVGDFRAWTCHKTRRSLQAWAPDHEIWRFDLRDLDLSLFQAKLDRILREAFTRHLLLDSRPRKMALVLDPNVPLPLLSATLNLLFDKFQAPVVSLLSSPTMAVFAAGVRSALVIDMGWAETVVTSVYEYTEVRNTRTIRAGRCLLERLYELLKDTMRNDLTDRHGKRAVSFDECEDIVCRLIWCRSSHNSQASSPHLDTVEEQEEADSGSGQPNNMAEVSLRSYDPPQQLRIPLKKLADLCDDTFFDSPATPGTFDDHELPVHRLIHDHLSHLSVDVRAICMSRIIFTGGCANILGIKKRIMDELDAIVRKRGWLPVWGRRSETLLHRFNRGNQATQPTGPASQTVAASPEGHPTSASAESRALDNLEADPIEAKILRNRPVPSQVQGQLRALHSLGAWAGASLSCQLKVPAVAIIDREQWLQQGSSGASRPTDVDLKLQKRQSLGAGGLVRGGAGHHANWTLGVWGNV